MDAPGPSGAGPGQKRTPGRLKDPSILSEAGMDGLMMGGRGQIDGRVCVCVFPLPPHRVADAGP